MANILYRGSNYTTANTPGSKSAPLTNDEIDRNFYSLDALKFDKAGGTVSGATTFSNNVTISGNLTVDGTTTTINTATLSVDDINVVLGDVASPSDATANGGGITLKGQTDKTIIWDSTNSNWTSSEHWNIASGKSFKINNVSVLSSTTLGSGVTSSSLTKLGTTAGFVKSDASGNLTADTNTYLTSETDTLGTVTGRGASTSTNVTFSGSTAITLGHASANIITTNTTTATLTISTLNSAVANTDSGGINITTGNGLGTGDSGTIIISSGNGGASANGNSGSIAIRTGNATTSTGSLTLATGNAVASANIQIYAGDSSYAAAGFSGNVYITGGSSSGNAAAANAGDVIIKGGANTAANGTGGNVTIDGGAGASYKGVVSVGTSANTASVSIGQSNNTTQISGTVKLPGVGTSGFVSLGAGGQLSATAASTTNVSEGNNLYYTNARARGAISVAGSLSYDSSTGIITGTDTNTWNANALNVAGYVAAPISTTANKVWKTDGSGNPAWRDDADTNTTYSNGTGLALSGTTFSVSYGSSAGTACEGNDSRLSDARTPTAHSHYIGNTLTNNYSTNQALSGITLLTTPAAGATETDRINFLGSYITGESYTIRAKDGSGNISAITLGWDGTNGHVSIGAFYQGGTRYSNYPIKFTTGDQATEGSINVTGFIKATRSVKCDTFYPESSTTYYLQLNSTTTSLYARGKLVSGLSGTGGGGITLYGSPTAGVVNAGNNHALTITPAYTQAFGAAPGGAGYSAAFDTALYGFAFYKAGTSLMQIDENGNVTATANITAYSDARLKTNVKTIQNALDTTLKLRGVTFEKGGEAGIGVIAQEVREILPEVVLETNDENKTLSVAYGNIVGVLIEAIKELNAKVEDLQNQLANK